MTKKNQSQAKEQKPIAPILKKMKVYQAEIYPISRTTVVKSCATLLRSSMDLVFRTTINKSDKVIIITRIK